MIALFSKRKLSLQAHLQEPDTRICITCAKQRTPPSPLLQEPDSPQNKVRANFDRPQMGILVSSEAPSTWHSPVQGAAWWGAGKVGAQALHPCGVTMPDWSACATTLLRANGISTLHHGFARVTIATVIDLPLLNPRGHIEVQCKICWSLNSFQVMAHVSGNKSMCRQQ